MLTCNNNLIRVSGQLTLETASAFLSDGCFVLDTLPEDVAAVFDLADLEQVDSAALGVVFAWARHASALDRSFVLKNSPQQLISLAAVYGVNEVLPLA